MSTENDAKENDYAEARRRFHDGTTNGLAEAHAAAMGFCSRGHQNITATPVEGCTECGAPVRYDAAAGVQPPEMLSKELAALLNRFSIENHSDTPDVVLAAFLVNALDAFAIATQARDKWKREG